MASNVVSTEDDVGAGGDLVLTGEVIAERYRIAELIGRGGMGAVYRADHVHIRKSFALKVLHRELTHHAESVKRFEREAIAAARIDHPNVATAIDFGRLPSGAFYLVLDYVQGRSLRQLLEQERVLPEVRALRIARQIASALAAAHTSGVVHRDLKPDNVMLVEATNEPDYVKVLDFGIAKLRTEDIADEPAITRFGTVFGTPEYMSPEQALGQSVDARSDLYTLGIMLYEMLVGKTPFADEQLVTVLTRQLTEPPSPLPATVTPELRQLVERLLEKRPETRPSSAGLVLSELDDLLARHALDSVSNQRPTSREGPSSPDLAHFGTSDTVLAAATSHREALGTAPGIANPSRTFAAANQTERSALDRTPSLPPWVRRQIRVGSRRVPLVVLVMLATLMAGLTIGGLGIWAIFSRRNVPSEKDTSILPPLLAEASRNKQQRLWMDQAIRGDPGALQKLESLAESSRDGAIWLAIAAGRAEAKKLSEAVAAYKQAAATDPKLLLRTPRALSDLHRATLDPQSSAMALEVASDYLGAVGADLVYASHEASTAGRAPKVDRRKLRSHLESPRLTEQASAALTVTLKLEAARSCSEYKALLPEATASGDQRAHRLLRKLAHDRGCGLLGLQDCYSCLRGSKALAQALDATKARQSPTFVETDPTTSSSER